MTQTKAKDSKINIDSVIGVTGAIGGSVYVMSVVYHNDFLSISGMSLLGLSIILFILKDTNQGQSVK